MSHSDQVAAVGASNYALLRAQVVSWSEVVTRYRVRTLREVLALNKVSLKTALAAGVKPGIAARAYAVVNSPEAEMVRAHRAALTAVIEKAGISQQALVDHIAHALTDRVVIVGGAGRISMADVAPVVDHGAALAAILATIIRPKRGPRKPPGDDRAAPPMGGAPVPTPRPPVTPAAPAAVVVEPVGPTAAELDAEREAAKKAEAAKAKEAEKLEAKKLADEKAAARAATKAADRLTAEKLAKVEAEAKAKKEAEFWARVKAEAEARAKAAVPGPSRTSFYDPELPTYKSAKATVEEVNKRHIKDYVSNVAGLSPDATRSAIDAGLKNIADQHEPYIRIHGGPLEKVLTGGRFKSQFETNTSQGSLDPDWRSSQEEMIFATPKTVHPEYRPIYGFLGKPDFGGFGKGIENGPAQYGTISVKLKPSVRQRTMLTVGDSLGQSDNFVGTPLDRPSALSISIASNRGNRAAEILARNPEQHAANYDKIASDVDYLELQYLGGVKVGDIAEVAFSEHEKPSPAVQKLLADKNIPWRIVKKP